MAAVPGSRGVLYVAAVRNVKKGVRVRLRWAKVCGVETGAGLRIGGVGLRWRLMVWMGRSAR